MNVLEFDGKDLDDALRAAGRALRLPIERLDYELVEEGRKGVFGLGARPVRIRVKSDGAPSARPEEPETSPAERPAPEPPAAQDGAVGSAAAATLRRIIDLMGLSLVLEEVRRDGSLEIVADGPDRRRLTAKDGELLDALEFVLNRMARRQWPEGPPVRLVCRGFTSERDVDLVALVREVASQVARSGQPKRLHAMNPYERRVVHVTVREFAGLTTVSEGDGFLKRVRVQKAGS
jgi:spoIIIJ-associated protein